MKKAMTVVLIVMMACLVGCSSQNGMLQTVQKKYPDSEVRTLVGMKYAFLVRHTNGDVYLIKCLNNGDDEVTHEIQMFKGGK